VAVLFDPVRHEYRLEGRRVPSVTAVLRAAGASTDLDALVARSPAFATRLADKRILGTVLHADCHAFDDGDLILGTVHPLILPYLQAWATFRSNFPHLRPVARERAVCHPIYRYAGTLDAIFEQPSGRRVLVDIKTGDPEACATHLQLAAYAAAYLAEHPTERIHERWAVQLIPGRTIPYHVTPYSARLGAWADFGDFLSYLARYRAQEATRD
jgi:hypothetical protein